MDENIRLDKALQEVIDILQKLHITTEYNNVRYLFFSIQQLCNIRDELTMREDIAEDQKKKMSEENQNGRESE